MMSFLFKLQAFSYARVSRCAGFDGSTGVLTYYVATDGQVKGPADYLLYIAGARTLLAIHAA